MASDEWTTFFVGWNRISWNFHKLITSSYVNPRFRGVLHKKQTANRVTEVPSFFNEGQRKNDARRFFFWRLLEEDGKSNNTI